MQIVIPMAGEGDRFRRAGYALPKPLLLVHGKPMIEHVVSLFPREHDFIFVCNKEHLKHFPMRETLRRLAPSGKIVEIDYEKKGPVWGTLPALQFLKDDEPVIVNYCDFDAVWDYDAFRKVMAEHNYAGAIVCYKGFHPHLLRENFYAGVRTDEKNMAQEVKEKFSFTDNKMDSWQSNGTYYFQRGALVKKYFKELVEKKIECNGEYYVSLVYNLLIRDGLPVTVFPVEYFSQWGTPEDLEEHVRWTTFVKAWVGAGNSGVPAAYPAELARSGMQHEELAKTFAYWQNYGKYRTL
jgi:NDP-sugar pyrophosphorylase family protein